MDLIGTLLGAIGAATGIGGLVVGLRANKTARRAGAAAAELTAIEGRSEHAALTPEFEVTWKRLTDRDMILTVKLIGPKGLDRLDSIEVFVRDDDRDRSNTSRRMGGPTPTDIANQVWGPFRFSPGVDGAVATGKRVGSFPLVKGASRPLAMQRTDPPPWSPGPPDYWGLQYRDHPVRLTFVCERAGYPQWAVPLDVYVGASDPDHKALPANGASESR